MRRLIAYAGKTGTTEKCAQTLAKMLGDCRLCDLAKESADPEGYDLVVVGAAVRMGMIHKAAKEFIDRNADLLSKGGAAYFICCGFADKADEYFGANLPQALRDSAVAFDSFGGELDLNKLKGFDKIIAKMAASQTGGETPRIIEENITAFADKLKAHAGGSR